MLGALLSDMEYRKFETGLAWFSLLAAFVHFVLETRYHVTFGQVAMKKPPASGGEWHRKQA
jgi:hypothetical protein